MNLQDFIIQNKDKPSMSIDLVYIQSKILSTDIKYFSFYNLKFHFMLSGD